MFAGMSTKLKNRHVTIRVDDELAEAIEAEAARERRTAANLMRNLLADALAARRSSQEQAAA
jgi:predicted transcriptional regulator